MFAAARNVALLLQAADEMLFAETVLGELEFGTRFRALPPEPVLDVAGAVEFFGFRGREQDSPWELSQGGRQRLALAAILVGAPGILVLDEPTTGQDADHMRAFLALHPPGARAHRADRADGHPRHPQRGQPGLAGGAAGRGPGPRGRADGAGVRPDR